MYYLCDCCRKPINSGGAYRISVLNEEFCVCSLCDLYFGYLVNDENDEIAKIGNFWAGFILEYEMVKEDKKESFAKMYCRLNNKRKEA